MAVLQKFVWTHLNVDLIALIGKSGDLKSHYSSFPGGQEGHFWVSLYLFDQYATQNVGEGFWPERPASLQQSSITALEVVDPSRK